MDRDAIRKSISGDSAKSNDVYEPAEITSHWPSDLKKGTRIVLSGLATSLSGMTVEGLRRRLARRFSIIGPKFNFKVSVNGEQIGPERRKEELEKLDNVKDESLDQVLQIFRSIDDLEISYYGQIVQGRLNVVETLQEKLDLDDKELAIRDYIFNHLWLLDPSWERAKGTEHAETLVNKFLSTDTAALKGEERNARIDIGYRTTGGKHIIIELKRASVRVPIDDLTKQIRRYRDGARRVLRTTEYVGWPIEIICLVGKPPPEWDDVDGTGPKGVIDALKNVDVRIVFYDQLLTNSQQAYADHLEEHIKIDKLWHVFQSIDNFAPPMDD